MSLSTDQTRRVATLARLAVPEESLPTFATQLSAILGYIEQLNELDTDGVEPTSHTLDLKNVFRDDATVRRFADGVWTKNAPSADQGHLRVPKVIDEE
jgi:aspartyl-tRNA(Asn)/glutamyl-tRNA(Gln) amidotransferase subunit C